MQLAGEAAASEVWHRKGAGTLGNGFIALFRHAGEVYRPSPASVVKIRWTWAADQVQGRWAYARFYALYRTNPELTLSTAEHMYCLLAALGWQLDYSVLILIRRAADVVPQAVLQRMANDPELLVDSNWIVSDGVETLGGYHVRSRAWRGHAVL